MPHPSLPPGKGADDEGFWANMGGDTSLLAELPRFSLPSVGMSLGEEPPTLSMPEDLPRKQ